MFFEFFNKLWNECFVAGGERRCANHVHVGVDCLLCRLGRRREKGSNVNVEAEVGETGGDHFRSAVMSVLAHFCDEDAWAATLLLFELCRAGNCGFDLVCFAVFRLVRTRDLEQIVKKFSDNYSCIFFLAAEMAPLFRQI